MEDNDKKEIQNMIDTSITGATKFSKRKIGDTPTDDNQLVPRGYVNLAGLRTERPSTVSPGQQYFSIQDHYPWFTDGVSSWFSATGSIVSAL